MDPLTRWEGPRKVVLEKSPQGFGFTLRQFIVYPPESTVADVHTQEDGDHHEDGVSLVKSSTSLEPMDTIFVKQVRDGSPAKAAGLNPGDRIVSVNGENISGKEYKEVVDQIQSSKSMLTLQVVPRDEDILQMAYPSSSVKSPRNKPPPVPQKHSPINSPSRDENDSVLSDDDVIIVGRDPQPGKQDVKTERTEVHIPAKQPQTFSSKVEMRIASQHRQNTGSIPLENRVVEMKIPKRENVLRKHNSLDLPRERQSATFYSDPGIENRTSGVTQKEPKTFRITGILGSPVSKPVRPSATFQVDGNSETGTASLMSKYVSPSNILPSKPVLIKVDLSDERLNTGDDRKLGVPVRMKVVPKGQANSPKRSEVVVQTSPLRTSHERYQSGNVSENIQTEVERCRPTAREAWYDSNRTNVNSTSMDTILDASNPIVKITKSSDVFEDVYPNDSIDSQNHNFNRKLSDSNIKYRPDKSKVSQMHEENAHSRGPVSREYSHKDNRGYQQIQIIQQGKMEETNYQEADGKLKKKFTFQTTATINVPDRSRRRREGSKSSDAEMEGPPIPNRTSSRGRVRERSLERDKEREKAFHEKKQRSKSYDRGHLQSNVSASMRQHAAYAERAQESQLLQQRLSESGRKDSAASSSSAGSRELEQFGASKQYLVRRTSYLRATGSDEENEKAAAKFSPLAATKEEAEGKKKRGSKKGSPIQKPTTLFDEAVRQRVNSEGDQKPSPKSIPNGTGDVIKAGLVNVKIDHTKDGKKSTWRSVWANLKNNTLTLLKENRNSSGNTSGVEEDPIDIRQAMVDIAYIKRKNVFRLCTVKGDDYLFQVNDKETMLAWINCIRANRNTGEEEKGIISEDIIIRRGHMKDPHFQQPLKSPSPGETKAKPPSKKPSSKDEISKNKQSYRGSKKKKKGGGFIPTHEETVMDSCSFGLCLEDCTPSPNNEFVPYFVDKCCSIVEERGLDVVGVYRVPGNNGGISFLKAALRNPIQEVDFSNEKWQDVNVVSSLLKLFFRKLPNPLIPKDQYSDFIKANRSPEPSERLGALRRQIHNLPEQHFETLKFLTNHLKRVANNCHINKMEIRNLAIVFGPTLIRTADDNMMAMVQDMSDQCCIVESVIQHCDWFFSEDVESQQAVPSDAIPDMEAMPDANVLLEKAKKESRGDTIFPKDIMQSVFSAANKKLKKDRKSLDFKDGADSLMGERGSRSRSGSTQSSDNQLSSKESSRTDSQSTDNDFSPTMRNPKETHTSSIVISTGSRNRKDSGSDSCSSKGMESPNYPFYRDFPDFQFGSVRGRNLSDGSEDFLESLSKEMNSGTVNWMVRESSPHLANRWKNTEYARKRELIEKEHAKAVQDYEKEDSNLDEFIKSKDFLKELCVSTKLQEMEHSSNYQDSSSVTSDYSTTSSNNNNLNEGARNYGSDLKNRSLPITPDSQESQGSVEESDFFKSVTAAFDEKFHTMFREDGSHVSSPEENIRDIPQRRSRSFTTCVINPGEGSLPSNSEGLPRPSSLTLSPKHSSQNQRTGSSSSLPLTPRSHLKKSRVEVTVFLEKIEKTPKEEKPIAATFSLQNTPVASPSPPKSSQSTPIRKSDSLREKRQRHMDRKRRHTLGGIKDVKNIRTIEITLFGEHTCETPRHSTSSNSTITSYANSGDTSTLERQENSKSNPNLRNSLDFSHSKDLQRDSSSGKQEVLRRGSQRSASVRQAVDGDKYIHKQRSLDLDQYL